MKTWKIYNFLYIMILLFYFFISMSRIFNIQIGSHSQSSIRFIRTVRIAEERALYMFITRECDYAVRVIRALAGESRLSVNEICEKESITAPFAYKILKKLQKSKIVRQQRKR